MIAVCLSSRGLVYTRTMQSIFDGIAECQKHGLVVRLITSHDLSIPDAQNFVTETALQDSNVKKLFFIEEDMFVFPQTFLAMVTSDGDITTLQYNDKNGSPHGIIHYDEQGEILWAGLGATIIKREVFEKIGQPYFETKTRYRIIKKHLTDGKLITTYEEVAPHQDWDETNLAFIDKKEDYKYGGLDINLYTKARKLGFKPQVLEGHKAHHFALVKLGEPHTNNGCHEIRQV